MSPRSAAAQTTPTDPATVSLAGLASLGRCECTFYPRRHGADRYVHVGIVAAVSVLLVGLGVSFPDRVPAVVRWTLGGSGVALLVLMLGTMVLTWPNFSSRQRARVVHVYEHGFVLMAPKGPVDAYRFDQIAEIRHRFAMHQGQGTTQFRVQVRMQDGREIKLSEFLADIGSLYRLIDLRVCEVQTPLVLGRIRAGLAVPFGPYSVSEKGVSLESGEMLAWPEIEGFASEGAQAYFQMTGATLRHGVRKLADIPNLATLDAVVAAMRLESVSRDDRTVFHAVDVIPAGVVTPAVASLATSANLGAYSGTFPPRKERTSRLVAVVCIVLTGLGLLVGAGLKLPDPSTLVIVFGAAITAFGLWSASRMTAFNPRQRAKVVHLYADGFLPVRAAGPVGAYRFDQIHTVHQKQVEHYINGQHAASEFVLTVTMTDRRTVRLNQEVFDIAALAGVIQSEVASRHSPAIIATIDGGRKVTVGEFTLGPQGVGTPRLGLTPWAAIEGVAVRQDQVLLRCAGQLYVWSTRPASEVPNLGTLLAVVDQMRLRVLGGLGDSRFDRS